MEDERDACRTCGMNKWMHTRTMMQRCGILPPDPRDEQIATLTHRAEAAEQSAALWRERCNKAEARTETLTAELRRLYAAVCHGQTRSDDARAVAQAVIDEYIQTAEQCDRNDTLLERMGESRSLCIEALRGVQATGDVDAQTWDVVADGIRALRAERDALALDKSVILDQLRAADEWCERDAAVIAHREFMAAGWKRLARHYQSCHLAGHACLRETHRAKGEQVAALRRARDDDAAYRSDLMEQCDKLRAQVREAATARDAALANADAVLSTAEALRVERDNLRAKLARAEGVVAVVRGVAQMLREHAEIGDEMWREDQDELMDAKAIEIVRELHVSKALAALATYEEG